MKSNDEIIAEITKADNEGDFAKACALWSEVQINKSMSDAVYIHQHAASILVKNMLLLAEETKEPPGTFEELKDILFSKGS